MNDFEEQRADGRLVLDYPARKLMVYPNTSGHVVLVCEEDGQRVCLLIDPDEIGLVCGAMLQASVEAKRISNALSSEYEAHMVISSAMGDTK